MPTPSTLRGALLLLAAALLGCGGGGGGGGATPSVPAPVAAFTASATTTAVGQTVAFTDASTGSPTAWSWTFGDGSGSTAQHPGHAWAAAGSYTVTLTATNAGGSSSATRTVAVTAAAPAAAFTFSPAAPTAGQTVTFTDASTGGPTSWAWSFGDGTSSTLQNPAHTFATAGTYSVALTATGPGGSSTATRSVPVSAAAPATAFRGSVVLGCPTGTSVKANVYSPDQGGTVVLAWGTVPGALDRVGTPTALQAGVPLELSMEGLQGDRRHTYRLDYQAPGQGWSQGQEASFHTARAPGSTFTFCLQGDSHPERERSQFNAALYSRTLLTAAADQPDFYLALGDDFSIDTLDPVTVTAAQVTGRYTLQRPWLGLIGRSAPLFLVNGNHEQAARYLLDGTDGNVAVWAQNARNAHYSQPAPDAFYTGNPEVVPHIGLLRNHFAWTWGDALFVVLDPYWSSPVCVDDPFYGGAKRTSIWDITHGDAQVQWLRTTLEQSRAKWKFVFAHHVMGTGRGGVELAQLYEWGGMNANGTWGLTANRPGWTRTIHQLLADNRVTVFFQGHDHIWVRQQLDGVTYQTLPEPADPNYALYNSDAFLTGDRLPNTGYARVTVSPTGVRVEYVRTWLPADEGPGRVSGTVAAAYTLQ